ncbi:MAG: PEFG-CTERM sorting domain-containing protein [Nitrosopumilus sp. H13]|nr:MAG: PEFG-CTERM sorting domain-containing protein [Nitrosopumilus sp. H13]
MNNRTSFALLAILAVAGTMTASAYAQVLPECIDCSMEEIKEEANRILLGDLPIVVWTDAEGYGHSDTITLTGKIANIDSVSPVLVRVTSPLNSIVTIKQISPDDIADDGSFEASLNTAGSKWKYDGTYTIQVNYGSSNDKIKVELTGGVAYEPKFATPAQKPISCGDNELIASEQCIPYTISGGIVTGAFINTKDTSVVINIESTDDGILTINPAKSVQDGIFAVLVDGQESDDVEYDGNMVTVMFPAGTEQIEVFSTFVIPEFGAIAAMILAVAIISIIAVSARSRLSIMPRY